MLPDHWLLLPSLFYSLGVFSRATFVKPLSLGPPNNAAWVSNATPQGAGGVFSLSGFYTVLLAFGAKFWHIAGEMKTCRRGWARTERGTAAGACWARQRPCTYQVSPPWRVTGDMQEDT